MVELSLLLFFLGLFFGSFFLVVIDRLPKQISPLTGRSKCDYCGHVLSWIDLIPLFSYASTGGKCRYCHHTLSRFYPGVEVLTGILFGLVPILLPYRLSSPQNYSVELIYALFVLAVCIIVFFIDLKDGLIPFVIVIPASVITIIYTLLSEPASFLMTVIAALGAGGFFFLIFFLTKGRGMGFGDVVLAFYMGLLLGFPGVALALYVAFLTGAAVSLILILSGKKKMKGGTIPFGPFLIIGALTAFFWQESLLSLITGYLLR